MNKGTQVYRIEWRDLHDDSRSPPTVLVRVAFDPGTHEVAFLAFELQAALHAMIATLQEAHGAQ